MMKTEKLAAAALGLAVLVSALLIVGPTLERRAEVAQTAPETADGKPVEASSAVREGAREVPRFVVQLAYTEYLVAPPYQYEADGAARQFRFGDMAAAIVPVRDAVDAANAEDATGAGRRIVTYIDNYKNRNGAAPRYYGKSADAYGASRGASAPAYADASGTGEFRYFADGTLVTVLSDANEAGLICVNLVGDSSPEPFSYYVPQQYVRTDDPLTELKKVIVVDRTNQNIAAFERYPEGETQRVSVPWKIVSYSLATTGKSGRYHQPTPVGNFYAIETKPRFYYLKDGTENTIEGYAPYAIRFTAGAYIHGVATAYRYGADGSRIDPGIQEYSDSIGTIPLSHKCVRNYTSHAKFLYDWYEHGKTVVIVIE